MDTEVLKEPRGFIRCLEWLAAIAAFALCASFSTHCAYEIRCLDYEGPIIVTHQVYYPFKVDHLKPDIALDQRDVEKNRTAAECFNVTKTENPGDFHNDAQFFVFTGVLAWLGATVSLVIYVFFSQRYLNDGKKAPLIDFYFTALVAVFWFCASSAWANGVIGLMNATSEHWLITSSMSPCQLTDGEFPREIESCNHIYGGYFKGANASILLGFLSFFLWTSNLWFIYKETKWFANRSESSNKMEYGVEQTQQMEYESI